MMRSVRDIAVLENIPVLVRASLNVPIENGVVTNDYRLRKALLTIRFLTERNARVVLISHLGEKGTETLAPVAKALGGLIHDVSFCNETVGARVRAAIHDMHPGHVLVLENLRRNQGERENTPAFAQELATLADVFVQDSFDTCHRVHASMVGVPKFLPSYAGLQVEEEVVELSSALTPARASLAVIGGAKFSTKEAVLTRLLEVYGQVFVGGALANDFLKAAGFPVGKSLVSDVDAPAIKKVLNNPRLVIPVDSLVVPASAMGTPDVRSKARVALNEDVREDEIILDHGPKTSELLEEVARKAKNVLWNGPLGMYESNFVDATNNFAKVVAATNAHSVIGGGDTIAAIESLGLLSRFSFVSTGGGAMLDFLAKGTLPGIDALQ
jgi:phosphoglycerate kinase